MPGVGIHVIEVGQRQGGLVSSVVAICRDTCPLPAQGSSEHACLVLCAWALAVWVSVVLLLGGWTASHQGQSEGLSGTF